MAANPCGIPRLVLWFRMSLQSTLQLWMPSKEENKLSFTVVMHFLMSLVLQTKKSGCREEKSLPESLWTPQPHADENTCARLVSKRVLAVAAGQVESLGLCSAHAERSPRCLQN